MNTTQLHHDQSGRFGSITTTLFPAEGRLSVGNVLLAVFAVLIGVQVLGSVKGRFLGVNAPVVGHRTIFEPAWLVRLRYMTQSAAMVQEGYDKYKHSMFKVRRNDNDILVIPNKFVSELHNVSPEIINGSLALYHNHLGFLADMDLMLESDLHIRAVRSKITPSLGKQLMTLKEEMDYSLGLELPSNVGPKEDWTKVRMDEVILHTMARTSARLFLGTEASRNHKWIETTVGYSEDLFITVVLLRMFPPWTHSILARFLPSYWRMQSCIRTGKRLVGQMVRDRRALEASGGNKPDDLLSWMMDHAKTDKEKVPESLGNRTLITSMAAIHTTGMAALHTLYDIVARPELFAPLREEITQVLLEDKEWKQGTMNKLRKLDSVMKESQRLNPLSQLGFNRWVRKPLTLSDGTVLPANTQFNCANAAISLDPEFVPGPPDPTVFDPWRWSRLREDPLHPEEANKHQFAMTGVGSLHFGHGQQACPGRFMASDEVKLILALLLLRYDFRYPDGQSRPRNLNADENVFPEMSARLLIKEREPTKGLEATIGF